MTKLALAAVLGASSLALAACGDTGTPSADANNAAAANEAAGAAAAEGNVAADGAETWARDARIVEENGVTYRVQADGTRVALGTNESRIVVENKVRYRVDPDGTRVKIDDRGAAIDIDLPDVDLPDVDLPDVDAGINKKGNPDIDVKDKDDGNKGPN